jgi:[ribosomal protein S18]-alanine N-acetyltransferase
MIGGLFNRTTQFDIVSMDTDHCVAAAKLHSARFARAWSAEEIDALLSQTNVRAFAARAATAPSREIAGFVMARFAADEAEILTVAVDPRHEGRGLGWRLMQAVARQLRTEGAAALFLEVDETNGRAVRLYRNLGFATVAERSRYYVQPDGRRTAALVMRLDLI